MAIPELKQFSEKTQELVNKMMFEHFSLTWPDLVKQARHRMRKDLKAAGDDSPEKYHPNLASLFNFYLNRIQLTAESEILNEFWRMLFSKEYKKMQMKKLEMEIDLSDVQTIPYHRIHDVFWPYGMVICLEKSNTLRIRHGYRTKSENGIIPGRARPKPYSKSGCLTGGGFPSTILTVL